MQYFGDMQQRILEYRDFLDKNNMVIDKTNMMFLQMILDILTYLATADATKLDEQCEYNILTMRKEFEEVLDAKAIDEKGQTVLLTFFFRIANEMKVRYNTIDSAELLKLFEAMTSKDFKYPNYIGQQKEFALEKMPTNIKRMAILG